MRSAQVCRRSGRGGEGVAKVSSRLLVEAGTAINKVVRTVASGFARTEFCEAITGGRAVPAWQQSERLQGTVHVT